MNFSTIVLHDKNRVIGGDNKVLWSLPEHLKRFRDITFNSPIIMGRKTFDLMGEPISDRENIILSRNNKLKINDCLVYNNITDILFDFKNRGEVFVIGGGEIYEQFFPYIDRIYVTSIDGDYKGDIHFPEYGHDLWTKFFESSFDGFTQETWIRKKIFN